MNQAKILRSVRWQILARMQYRRIAGRDPQAGFGMIKDRGIEVMGASIC
jgi:hypothetical protein